MSMHTYPVGGYGLYVNDREAATMLEHARLTGVVGQEDDMANLAYAIDASLLDGSYELDGWSVWLRHDPTAELEYAQGLFLYANRRGSVVATDLDDLYLTEDDMIDELRAGYGSLLPDSFDYSAHLGEFRGTLCC